VTEHEMKLTSTDNRKSCTAH